MIYFFPWLFGRPAAHSRAVLRRSQSLVEDGASVNPPKVARTPLRVLFPCPAATSGLQTLVWAYCAPHTHFFFVFTAALTSTVVILSHPHKLQQRNSKHDSHANPRATPSARPAAPSHTHTEYSLTPTPSSPNPIPKKALPRRLGPARYSRSARPRLVSGS